MKQRYALFVFVTALLFATRCFAHHLAVVVDKGNSLTNVTSSHLARIVRHEDKKWPDGRDIMLVLHSDSKGERLTLQRLTKTTPAGFQSLLHAHQQSIKVVDSDEEVLKYVESTPGAVGFVELPAVNDQVNVVKVDGKLPEEAGYLSH